jgi:hypothetical protein
MLTRRDDGRGLMNGRRRTMDCRVKPGNDEVRSKPLAD